MFITKKHLYEYAYGLCVVVVSCQRYKTEDVGTSERTVLILIGGSTSVFWPAQYCIGEDKIYWLLLCYVTVPKTWHFHIPTFAVCTWDFASCLCMLALAISAERKNRQVLVKLSSCLTRI